MKRIVFAALALPLLVVYAFSDRHTVRLDAGRWDAIDRTGGRCFDSPPSSLVGLLCVLGRHPEFRSLFYARARSHSLGGNALSRFFGLLWRGAPGLLIGVGEIGPGLYIEHGFGTILAADKIGRDCWINQDVTLATDAKKGGSIVGDRVFVRMGAKVLGGTVIGNDSEIGANAVVTREIPSGVVAVGVPAKAIGPNPRLTTPDAALSSEESVGSLA